MSSFLLLLLLLLFLFLFDIICSVSLVSFFSFLFIIVVIIIISSLFFVSFAESKPSIRQDIALRCVRVRIVYKKSSEPMLAIKK